MEESAPLLFELRFPSAKFAPQFFDAEHAEFTESADQKREVKEAKISRLSFRA
jgi:hypothetical protein